MIQEARASDTAGIFAEMEDDERREAARAALAYLEEMTPGLRRAEIATADGTVLATRGASLEGRLEQEGGDESDGRAFTVSEQGLSLTAITEPAAPPTLTDLDLRTTLSIATPSNPNQ